MAELKRVRPSTDSIPDGRMQDESGIQPVLLPSDSADRRRIQNLLGGRFLDMYQLSLQSHHRFDLRPGIQELERGYQEFPDALSVSRSFTPDEYALASSYDEPALVKCPPGKTTVDLLGAIQKGYIEPAKTSPLICDSAFALTDCDDRYRSFIVESAPNIGIQSGDVRIFPPAMRMRGAIQRRHPLGWGMTGEVYALLVMQSIVRGKLIDTDGWTILDGEKEVKVGVPGFLPATYIPVGSCMRPEPDLPFKPSIEWIEEGQLDTTRCRFRRVLGGRLIEPGL